MEVDDVDFCFDPCQKLSESKVRLSSILKPEERRDFTLAMLTDVLKTVFSSSISRTVVVSSDGDVRNISLKREVAFFQIQETIRTAFSIKLQNGVCVEEQMKY